MKNKEYAGLGGIEIPPKHKNAIKNSSSPKKKIPGIVKLLLGAAAIRIFFWGK